MTLWWDPANTVMKFQVLSERSSNSQKLCAMGSISTGDIIHYILNIVIVKHSFNHTFSEVLFCDTVSIPNYLVLVVQTGDKPERIGQMRSLPNPSTIS
jgi:hypothetical protein